MHDAFAAAGLRDVVEEEVEGDLVHASPEQYWEFITDIAAPVVAGLAKADDATRMRIREEVLDLVQAAARDGGEVRMRSTARVIAGTR